jgi:hypothetical protein
MRITFNGVDITEHCEPADLAQWAARITDVRILAGGEDITKHYAPALPRLEPTYAPVEAVPVPYQCRRCGCTLGHVNADGVLRLSDGIVVLSGQMAESGAVAFATIKCPQCEAQRRWYDIRVRRHHA